MTGLCECGCGERTRLATQSNTKLGHVKGEPVRFVLGHARRKSPVEYVEEDRGFDTPCWIWQKALTAAGYGQGWDGSRVVKAHRWMYERLVGPIPHGHVLDHLCNQRACVNPVHLRPVEQRENVRRGAEHYRAELGRMRALVVLMLLTGSWD